MVRLPLELESLTPEPNSSSPNSNVSPEEGAEVSQDLPYSAGLNRVNLVV